MVFRVLVGVGVAITLVGVALLLTLAWQYGFFGPIAQPIAAISLAAVLVTAGVLVHRKDATNVGGPALVATGVATGYLTMLVASNVYNYLPAWATLSGAAAMAAGGLWVGRNWNREWVGVATLLGVVLLVPAVGTSGEMAAGFILALVATSAAFALDEPWRVHRVVETVPATLVIVFKLVPATWLGIAIAAAFSAVTAAVAAYAAARNRHIHGVACAMVVVGVIPLVVAAIASDQFSPIGKCGAAVALTGAGVAYGALATWRTPASTTLSDMSMAVAGILAVLGCTTWFGGRAVVTVCFLLAAAYFAAGFTMGRVLIALGVAVSVLGFMVWLVAQPGAVGRGRRAGRQTGSSYLRWGWVSPPPIRSMRSR